MLNSLNLATLDVKWGKVRISGLFVKYSTFPFFIKLNLYQINYSKTFKIRIVDLEFFYIPFYYIKIFFDYLTNQL